MRHPNPREWRDLLDLLWIEMPRSQDLLEMADYLDRQQLADPTWGTMLRNLARAAVPLEAGQ